MESLYDKHYYPIGGVMHYSPYFQQLHSFLSSPDLKVLSHFLQGDKLHCHLMPQPDPDFATFLCSAKLHVRYLS